MSSTYYPYPTPDGGQALASDFKFGIAVANKPDAQAPWLTVGGQVGFGFDLGVAGVYTYSADAPTLNVSGKARVWAPPTDKLAATDHSASAPALLVDKNVGIGFSLTKQDAYPLAAPKLNIAGRTRIWGDSPQANPKIDHPGSAPALLVDGSMGVGFSLKASDVYPASPPSLCVTGRTVFGRNGPGFSPKNPFAQDAYDGTYAKNFGNAGWNTHARDVLIVGTFEVTQDAVFGGRIFFFQNSVQQTKAKDEVTYIADGATGPQGDKGDKGDKGNTGAKGDKGNTGAKGEAGKDAQWPSFVYHDTTMVEPRYPVFCVVNGLTGHVQLNRKIPQSQAGREKLIHQFVDESLSDPFIKGSDDHYVLMGQLDDLLAKTVKPIEPGHRSAYGIRMKWEEGFAMLNLLKVWPDEKVKIYPAAKWPAAVKLNKPRRRRLDTVVAFGGTPDTLFRIRYVGGGEVRTHTDVAVSPDPVGAAPAPLVPDAPGRAQTRTRRGRVLTNPLEGGGDPKKWAQYRDVLVVHRDGVTINGPLYSTRQRPSDANLKEAVEPIQGALDKVMALRGVSYAWKDDPAEAGKKREYGLIAQEVKRTCPEAVSRSPQDFLAIDFDQITPLLLEALKEQQELIAAQRARLDELERRVATGEPAKKKRKDRKQAT